MEKRETKKQSPLEHDQFKEMHCLFHNAFYDSLDQWDKADSNDTAALKEGVDAISPAKSATTAKEVLDKIELWLSEQADEFIGFANASARPKDLREQLQYGWLKKAMEPHIKKVQTILKEYQNATKKCVEFVQENGGICGFKHNAFKTIKAILTGNRIHSIVDGVFSLFGEGSINKEGAQIDKDIEEVATQLNEAVIEADAALRELITMKWNTEIITLAETDDRPK